MPDNLLQTGGVGGISALIGSALTLLGFKPRIDRLEKESVTKDTCLVVQKAFHESLERQESMLKEMRTDIKQILKNGNK